MTIFESGDIPPDDDESIAAPDNALVCATCGISFPYAGRGRKPANCEMHRTVAKAPRGTAIRSGGQVEAALQILEGMYNGLAAGLMFAAPGAAIEWASRIPGLQQANRVALTADPDLTKRILALGKGGGKLSFVAAHVIAIAPVVVVARAEMKAKAQARPPKPAKPARTEPPMTTGDVPFMPTPPANNFFA